MIGFMLHRGGTELFHGEASATWSDGIRHMSAGGNVRNGRSVF